MTRVLVAVCLLAASATSQTLTEEQLASIAVIAPCREAGTGCQTPEGISAPAFLGYPIALQPGMQAEIVFVVNADWELVADSGFILPAHGSNSPEPVRVTYYAWTSERTRRDGYDTITLRQRDAQDRPFQIRIGRELEPLIIRPQN